MTISDDLDTPPFYHGTKADLIEPGYNSNYGKQRKAAWVCLSATLDAVT